MFVDSATGALGGGMIGPVTRVASRANKVIRHSSTRVYQVGAGTVESLTIAGYVSKPMISRPVRMEIIAGGVAGMVYDIAYGKSSGSSSERNGTHVGPGGTTSVEPTMSQNDIRYFVKAYGFGSKELSKQACPKGHKLTNVGGRYICVPNDYPV